MLQGNLCRCTGYRPILEAFQSFSSDQVDTKILQIPDNILSDMNSLSETAFGFNSKVSWNKPMNLSQVFMLMKAHPKHNLRAGGTGSYKKFQDKKYDTVIDISGIKELKTLTIDEEKITVGAGVTFTQLLHFLYNMETKSFLTNELCQVLIF